MLIILDTQWNKNMAVPASIGNKNQSNELFISLIDAIPYYKDEKIFVINPIPKHTCSLQFCPDILSHLPNVLKFAFSLQNYMLHMVGHWHMAENR